MKITGSTFVNSQVIERVDGNATVTNVSTSQELIAYLKALSRSINDAELITIIEGTSQDPPNGAPSTFFDGIKKYKERLEDIVQTGTLVGQLGHSAATALDFIKQFMSP